MSEAIKHEHIAPALAAAQMEMGKALKSETNPHFRSKYADLASVADACMSALNRHGIAVVQPLVETELGRSVVTRFIHASGEALECPVPLILGKQDMQGLGSAITYARRYGLMCLAGVAADDDDGNAAAATVKNAPPKQMSWAETIISELPDDATEHEKAEAIADNLCRLFARKRTEGELVNELDRRAKLINGLLKDRFPDLHERVVDAYENRMMAVTKNDVPREAAE